MEHSLGARLGKCWLLGILAMLLLGSAAAQQTFTQPLIKEVFPAENSTVLDRAAFALRLAKPLEPRARPQALCDVQGIRSAAPTELLTGPAREAALKAYGVPEIQHRDTEQPWIVIRCQTSFPDAAQVMLRWLRPRRDEVVGGQAVVGTLRWDSQAFSYTTRSDWPVSIVCSRSNSASGCNPLEAVALAFTQPVASGDAAQVRLRAADGALVAPVPDRRAEPNPWVSELRFARLQPEQNYTIVWPAKLATASQQDALANARNKQGLVVRMGPYPPLLKFAAGFGIAERSVGGVVPLSVRSIEGKGTAQLPPGRLHVVKVPDEAAIIESMATLDRLRRSDDAGPAGASGDEGDETPAIPAPRGANSQRYPFAPFVKSQANRNAPVGDTRGSAWLKGLREAKTQELPRQLEMSAFEVIGIPLKEPGFYLLEAESLNLGRSLLERNRPMYVRTGALVTDLAVHWHASERTALVWVTSLTDGQPVGSAAVSIYDCNAKRLAGGATNAQGWVQINTKLSNEWNCPKTIFARKDDDLGMLRSDWQRGIEMWRFDQLGQLAGADTAPQLVHAALARNLLRGGETFHARLFVRGIDPRGQLQAPKADVLPKTVSLVHTGSNDRKTVSVSWDARGNADLTYKLPEGIKRGAYRIEAGSLVVAGGQFRVEDFRLPVLKAEVLSPAQTVLNAGRNHKIDVNLRLSYLSGGPAAGESVQVSQRLLALTPRFAGYEDFWFAATDRYRDEEDGGLLEDADGSAVGSDEARRLDAQGTHTVSTLIKQAPKHPKTLLTEMEYRDPNGETYRAQGRSQLFPANAVLGIKADHWASGKERKVDLVAVSTAGRPLAGIAVSVEGGFANHVYHRRKTVGGYYGYERATLEFKPAPLCAGRTDGQGRFTCRFTPAMEDIEWGEFRVQASARDAQNRSSQAATAMWLYGAGETFFDQAEHDRMDVLVERNRYQPGETAVLQVRSPFREATAWVNILRSGVVVDSLVMPLSGQKPTLEIPVKASYGPNVFVNVLAVRGRVAEPQATALVDLARPAFKMGIAHFEVGTDAHLLRVKVSTDKASYQSRETATATIEVQAAAGQALPGDREVSVFAIDEALLELLPNDTWDALKTMMAKRGYGFESASAAMQVIGKRHYGRKALPVGGGGGKSASRELFDTLLVWRGSVELDAQGRAQVQIPVNDSLTRFRVVAIANAGADRFGVGHSSFVATKDLQLLSGLPATVREGDRLAAGFTLRNTTSAPMQVAVTAQMGEIALAPTTVSLQANEAKPVGWTVDVPVGVSSLKWQVRATAARAGRSDAITITQPVGTPLNALRFTAGAQKVPSVDTDPEPWVAVVQPPAGSVAGQGELRVSLSPALAADASGVRDYMRSYPFFCLEQRTSKAVSLKDRALWEVIAGSIDAYITDTGLVNYYPGQFGSEQGYDTLTAYVLSASQEAGWTLPADAAKRMLDGLERFVQGKLERRYGYYTEDAWGLTERKLLALEALARHRTVPASLGESLRLEATSDLPQLSNRAIVQWIDVLRRSDWPDKSAQLKTALAEFDKRLVIASDGSLRFKAHAAENRWYWMYSDSTSLVRAALLALDLPALKDRADGLARGALATQRGGSHWWETQANVWGSLMLDKRSALASGALSGQTVIAIGTETIRHDWGQLPGGHTYTVPLSVFAANPGGVGAVAFLHRGGGSPYAAVSGTSFGELKQAQDRGAELSKSMRPVRVKVPGQVTAGDIWEVQLRFKVQAGAGWLALSDPIPPGSTLLGNGLGGQAQVVPVGASAADARNGRRGPDGVWEAWPSYVERSFTHVRAYYEYLWGDRSSFTYQVRINNAGSFKLPPTQLEAMYDPSVFAYRPNATLDVKKD